MLGAYGVEARGDEVGPLGCMGMSEFYGSIDEQQSLDTSTGPSTSG